MLAWRMAMHHNRPKVFGRAQKWLPDPQQVFTVLLVECNARPNSRMDEEIRSKTIAQLQLPDKFLVRRWQLRQES